VIDFHFSRFIEIISTKSCKTQSRIYFATSILTFLTIAISTDQPTFQHDFSSYIVGINDLLSGTGGPYSQFFDIKPPFLYILLSPGFWLLGMNLKAAYIIFGVILFSFYLGLFLLVRKLNSDFKLFKVSIYFACIFIFSNLFSDMFFPIEIMCISFIIYALLLDNSNPSSTTIFIIAILLGISGQTKESFALTSVAYFLVLIWRRHNMLRNLFSFISGTAFVYLIVLFFLIGSNSFAPYLEVMNYKSVVFKFALNHYVFELSPRFFVNWISKYTLFGIWSLIPLFILIISLLRSRRYQLIKYPRIYIRNNLVPLVFLIAIVFGILIQNKGVTGHYALSLYPILAILILRVIYSLHSRNREKLLVLLLIILTLPRLDVGTHSFNHLKNNILQLQSNVSNMESSKSLIPFNFRVTRCLQVAYGWKAGAYYYYSKGNPCSPYFLSGLVANNKQIWSEFRRTIIENPPSEIYYDTFMTGLDVHSFEKNIFPYSKIIENCYLTNSNPKLFSSSSNSAKGTQKCIELQLSSF